MKDNNICNENSSYRDESIDVEHSDSNSHSIVFPFLNPNFPAYISRIVSILPTAVGNDLQSALISPSSTPTNIHAGNIKSNSYVIFICGNKTNPQCNQIQLRKSSTLINLNPGINILTVEKYPELKYGFYPKQVGGGVMSPNANCQSILEIDMSHYDASEIESTELMFGDMLALRKVNLSNVKFSNVRNMDRMFARCLSLNEIIINNIHTFSSDVLASSNGMFFMAISIRSLGMSYFGGKSLKSAIRMFAEMEALEELDLSGWNLRGVDAGNIEESLFEGCKNLKKIYMYGCNDLTVKKICSQLNNPYVSLTDVRIKRAFLKGAL